MGRSNWQNLKHTPTNKEPDFGYRGIVDDEYALLPDFLEPAKENVSQLQVKFSYSDSILTCTLSWRLSSADRPPYLVSSLYTEFAVSDKAFKAGLNEEGSELRFELSTLIQIATITVGALRGFVYAKLKNSSIQASLPLVNMEDLMKDHDNTFYLNSSKEEEALS